jgi:Flp pilus assembly protein TadD
VAGGLIKQGKFEEALASASEAVRLNPQLGAAHANRSLALSALGRHDEAMAAALLSRARA